MSAPSQIELRGLRVLGRHGVGEEERLVEQPFEVDLDVVLETGPAAASDDVDDTVDYGQLAEEVAEIVEDSSFHLVETLAEVIARTVLFHERVTEVTVSIRKLRPPVPLDLATAGVRITRNRGEGGGG